MLWHLSVRSVSTTVLEVLPSLACNSDGTSEIKRRPSVGISFAFPSRQCVRAPTIVPLEVVEEQMFLVDAVVGNSIGRIWFHKCPSLPTEIPPTMPRSQLKSGSQIECLIFE